VALSASGLPSGVTASFSPGSVNAGQGSTLTLSASSSAALGPAAFTVIGTGVSATRSAAGSLSVTGATAPPTVWVTSPIEGATVSGRLEIDATSAVAGGTTLLRIDLMVDQELVGSQTRSPAQAFWTSTLADDGPHTVTAHAVDEAGGSTVSAPVSITVRNAPASSGPGGCGSGGGGPLAVGGLLAWLRRRRIVCPPLDGRPLVWWLVGPAEEEKS
jgi:hypothetical protein